MLPRVNLISQRRKIMFGVYTAQTPEQIKMLRQAVDDWLSHHPEDKIIQRADRMLESSKERLRKAGKWH